MSGPWSIIRIPWRQRIIPAWEAIGLSAGQVALNQSHSKLILRGGVLNFN